jgi:hypothetical protein
LNLGYILGPLGTIILSLETLISTLFWETAVNLGIRSSNNYLFWEIFNGKLIDFQKYLILLIPVLLTFSALYSAIYLFTSKRGNSIETLIRMAESIFLFSFSVFIMQYLSILSLSITSFIFTLSGHWVYYFTPTYVFNNIGTFVSSSNAILEIAFDGIYFTSSISILGFLMIRDAILISFYFFIPFISLLLPVKSLRPMIIKIWILYLELLFSTSLILILIYFYINFNGFFFIQMGFLLLISMVPSTIIYSYYRISNNRLGLFSDLSLITGFGLFSGALESGVSSYKKMEAKKDQERKGSSPELYMGNLFQNKPTEHDEYE